MFKNISGLKFTKGGKLIGQPKEFEQSSIQGIYGLGDIVEGIPELMPVAQKSGKKLA